MTSRIVYTEDRKISNQTATVTRLENLSYSGFWEDGGYDVKIGNKIEHFFGWPTDSDIKNRFRFDN